MFQSDSSVKVELTRAGHGRGTSCLGMPAQYVPATSAAGRHFVRESRLRHFYKDYRAIVAN